MRKLIKIQFILDGGLSAEARGYDFSADGFVFNGRIDPSTYRVYVRFDSGQSAAIYKKDENVLWKRV